MKDNNLITERDGYKLYLIPEDHPNNPRTMFNQFGKMVCWHGRYNLGDKQPKARPNEWLHRLVADKIGTEEDPDGLSDELVKEMLNEHFVMLPLFLHDHSGLTMRTSSFNDPWDSSQVGWIYVSIDDIKKEFGEVVVDDATLKKARQILDTEVCEYNQYLTGDVWGYEINDSNGDPVDSCGGFYGRVYAEQKAQTAFALAIAVRNDAWQEEENRVQQLINRM